MLSWPSVNPLEMSKIHPLLPNVQVSAKTQFWKSARRLFVLSQRAPALNDTPPRLNKTHCLVACLLFTPRSKNTSVLAGNQQQDIFMETVH